MVSRFLENGVSDEMEQAVKGAAATMYGGTSFVIFF